MHETQPFVECFLFCESSRFLFVGCLKEFPPTRFFLLQGVSLRAFSTTGFFLSDSVFFQKPFPTGWFSPVNWIPRQFCLCMQPRALYQRRAVHSKTCCCAHCSLLFTQSHVLPHSLCGIYLYSPPDTYEWA